MSVRQIWVLRGNFVVAPILLGHFVTTDVGERKPLSGREDYNSLNVSPCILLTLDGEISVLTWRLEVSTLYLI